jgi:hypothetical protein
MKMHARWVAWMAALALAAMLVAAPREGAAGPHPYMFPDQPPGPSLGDPDGPTSGPAFLVFRWIRPYQPPLIVFRTPWLEKASKSMSRPYTGRGSRGRRE